MTDFERIIGALVDGGVAFIIVGGVAATVHGSSRLTQDLDVVYSRDPRNLNRLVSALAPMEPYLRGAPPNLPFRFDEETLARGLNFTLITSAGALDLLGEITGGGGFEHLISHSVEISLFNRDVRCLDRETLISVKRAAGRPRDLETVAELELLGELDKSENS